MAGPLDELNALEHQEIKTELTALTIALRSFIDQYETDMRGDKNPQNGRVGIVEWIRSTQKYLIDYPSITWLLKNRTGQTLSVIVGSYIVLDELAKAGSSVFELFRMWIGKL